VESSFPSVLSYGFRVFRALFAPVAPDAQRAVFPRLLARLPPLFNSAGLSPIGDLWASEKCAKTDRAMHTAFTTFPQAPKLCNFALARTQGHLFWRRYAALQILQKKETIPAVRARISPLWKRMQTKNQNVHSAA